MSRRDVLCLGLTVWLLLTSSACAVRQVRAIDGTGRLAQTPDGPTAVLRVTAQPAPGPLTGGASWGLINTANVEARFAEFIAHVGAKEGGLQVMAPHLVEKRLEEAGLAPTLQPTAEQIDDFAKALGLASYLTAAVECSRINYRFVYSWSTVHFRMGCRIPGRDEPVWQVRMIRKMRGASDREVMRTALAEVFAWLREPFPTDPLPKDACEP